MSPVVSVCRAVAAQTILTLIRWDFGLFRGIVEYNEKIRECLYHVIHYKVLAQCILLREVILWGYQQHCDRPVKLTYSHQLTHT